MSSNILPTVEYPPMIRGSLRLMLQLKDAFLACFNLVEEYRDQLLACQRGFARDLVVYQLTQGLAGITRLREDLANIEEQGQARMNRNTALRRYLIQKYSMTDPMDNSTGCMEIVTRLTHDNENDPKQHGTGTAVIGNTLPPPITAPDSVEAALHGGLDNYIGKVNVDVLDIPEEIDLATTTTENGAHLLPVVEFYRGFYFLQMHFQLIMCQAANYAMPVVTRSMGLAERAFSWPTMPSFGLAASSGSMKDRLLEINTEVLQLAERLLGCLALVREKIARDRKIESYYFQHTAAQEAVRRNLLRSLQSQRVYIDCLESQNDRLAGLAIKLDPNFAKSQEFQLMTGPGSAFREPRNKPDATDTASKEVNDAFTRDNHGIRKSTDSRFDGYPSGGTAGLGTYDSGTPAAFSGKVSSNSAGGERGQPRRYSSGNQQDNARNVDMHDTTPVAERDMPSNSPEPRNSPEDGYGSSHNDSDRNSGFDVQATDVNYSASGGGPPAIWVQQGTATSLGSGGKVKPVDRKQINVDVELTRRIEPARGGSRAVEELLIGVDSVASGAGRLATDGEHIPTPSFLNTEHYVTSIFDDVMGSSPHDTAAKLSGTPKAHGHPGARAQGLNVTPNLRTPSTKYSQAELISPAISVDQHAVTVNSQNSVATPHNSASPSSVGSAVKDSINRLNQDAHNAYYESKKRFKEGDTAGTVRSTGEHSPEVPDADYTDNTFSGLTPHMKRTVMRAHPEQPIIYQHQLDQDTRTPKPLDTNVNASDVVLPKILPRNKYCVPGGQKPTRSSSTSAIGPSSAQRRTDQRKHLYREQVESSPVTLQPEQRRFQSNQEETSWPATEGNGRGHAQLVPLVSTKECGGVCVPEWLSRRGSRENKPEDLLQEPKRSALSKAMMTHRFRLVETILQADEERLEDLISLLLKE